MKIKRFVLFMFFWVPVTLMAQSLFEDATGAKDSKLTYELGGYLRSTLYGGGAASDGEGEIKSGYGELSLSLKAEKKGFGDALAEFRMREGYEFGEYISEVNLREAYVNAYLGPFDLRVGHQIVVWGRADGFNPTDNITPNNMLARSPDEDDRRLGNFLIRTFYNAQPMRFEALWIPFFKSSVVPTNLLQLPPNVIIGSPDYPDSRFKNSTFAFKVNFERPSWDGSVSYFNGHNPFPGIDADLSAIVGLTPFVEMFPKSYRMHVLGADFATTVGGRWGIRGEFAYRRPHGAYADQFYIINPDLQYVIGVDREFSGNLDLILQYIGRYVLDFEELFVITSMEMIPVYNLALKNRLISRQQFELSHAISCRASLSLLHETLNLELLGYGNLTSEEFLWRPKLTYDITDAFQVIVGGELYDGPHDTLFGLIDKHLNSVFAEIRLSF